MVTIEINTTRFGTVAVEEASILDFTSPLLGFEHIKKYVLLDHAENSPFKWMQAVEDPDLAFVVTNPKFFGIPYEFTLPEDAVEKLAAKQAEDILVFTIVNIPNDNPMLMTANLLAPIVVNQTNLRAMQAVLQDAQFSTRTPLLPNAQEQNKAEDNPIPIKPGKG